MIDVLVVGGGPVGTLLAGELRLGGAEPLLLEATDGVERLQRSYGQRAINARSSQTLAMRGLAPALAAANNSWADQMMARGLRTGDSDATMRVLQMMREGKTGGHFAMYPLSPDTENGGRCYLVKQHMLEQILVDWAHGLGVRVEKNAQVTSVRDEGTHIVAELADGRSLNARYIVACDGGRSTVRKSAGFEFPGTAATMTGRVAYAELEDPSTAAAVLRGPNGLVNSLMMPGEITVVEHDGTGPLDRDAPMTAEELEQSMLRAGGVTAKISTLTGGTRFSDNTRQVDSYRRGRVLIAGDAAHVHSPIGGQGLNMGIQDAVNIGWKLALVVTGRAPESLLDTCTSERHPVNANILRSTRAQVALMRPGPQVDALREIMGEVIAIPAVHDYFADLVSGVTVDYAPDSVQPLIGRFTPKDLQAVTAEHMSDGRFLLLDLVDSEAIRKAMGQRDRVQYLHHTEKSDAKVSALLIRPDGYVAWVSANGESDGLAEVLRQWTGE